MTISKPRIAVVGAGLAGLSLATRLQSKAEITILEKSRGVGGRMASRTRDDYQFDFGAQFFTVRSAAFQEFLQPFIQQGVVQPWHAGFVEYHGREINASRTWSLDYPHYVATPKMSQLAKAVATELTIRLQTRLGTLERVSSMWHALDEQGKSLGTYDMVLFAIPVHQLIPLLPQACDFRDALSEHTMVGCYSLMLGFNDSLSMPWDAALVKQADISWMSVNTSKPGRRQPGADMVVLASNVWAEAHMKDDLQAVQAHLLQQAEAISGQTLAHADHQDIHRWRYANSKKYYQSNSYFDASLGIGACGDWCIQGRVEAAFTSGMHLADSVLNSQGN